MTADELKRLLFLADKTHGWLATELGVSQNTVARWAMTSAYGMPIPPSRDESIRALLAPDRDAA